MKRPLPSVVYSIGTASGVTPFRGSAPPPSVRQAAIEPSGLRTITRDPSGETGIVHQRMRSTTISSGLGNSRGCPAPAGNSTTFIGGDAVTVDTQARSGESECPSPAPSLTGGEPSLARRY